VRVSKNIIERGEFVFFMTERTHVIFNNIKYMFKQIKKARELQGEFSQNNDEFDIIQIILTVIFSIALVGI